MLTRRADIESTPVRSDCVQNVDVEVTVTCMAPANFLSFKRYIHLILDVATFSGSYMPALPVLAENRRSQCAVLSYTHSFQMLVTVSIRFFAHIKVHEYLK